MDNINDFFSISAHQVTETSLTDPSHLNQSDETFYKDAYILVWVSHNRVSFRKIFSYNPSTHTVSFDQTVNPPYDDRDGKYSLYNSVAFLDNPGEYAITYEAVDSGRKKIFVWPRNNIDETTISISSRTYGIDINRQSHITIDGFTTENFSGDGLTNGIGIGSVHQSMPISGITIRNNTVRHNRHAESGYGGIYLSNCSHCLIEDNTVIENPKHRGIFISTSVDSTIKNNTVRKIGSTGISFYAPTRGQIIENSISDIKGSHANGISVYLDTHDVLIAGNRIFNAASPLTFHSNNCNMTIYNNIIDASGGEDNINEWNLGLTENCTTIIAHNTLVKNTKHNSLNAGLENGNYIVKNNILDGGGAEENDRSHNLYIGLAWYQDERYDWSLAEGELYVENLDTVFSDYENSDYTLAPDSPAIDMGTDITPYLPIDIFPDYDFFSDIAGNPREGTTNWDSGAYNF